MMIPPPMPGGAAPIYGRGGPNNGGPPVAPHHMVGGARNGYHDMEHGVGRGFGEGRGGRFSDRGGGGGGGGFGGGGFSNSGFGDRRGGGRGREVGRSGRGFDLGRGGGRGGGYGGGRGGRGSRPRGDDLDNISLPKQDFSGLIAFKKDFYVESPSVRAMTEQEVMMYRARREITVEGHDVPKPIRMFHEANFPGISLIYCVKILYFTILITDHLA